MLMRVRSEGPGPRAGTVDLNKAPPRAPPELITSSISPLHVRACPDLPVTWPPRDTGMRWPRIKLDRFQHRTSLQVAAPG